jgi:hypothetical protein
MHPRLAASPRTNRSQGSMSVGVRFDI